MTCKISIVVPNLNSGDYIYECIRSIEMQTYQNYEVIVGDSMSDDCSRTALLEYADRDSRVRFFDLKREGIYKGWNDCIKMASGEFVYVCTSDDYISEDFLERVVASIDSNPQCDLFFTKLRFCDEESCEDRHKWCRMRSVRYLIKDLVESQDILGSDAIIANMVYGSVIVSMNQLVVRRQLYDEIGLYMTDLGGAADLVWKYQAYENSILRYVPETYAVWRNHDTQITSNCKTAQQRTRSHCREVYWSNQKLKAPQPVELALAYSRIKSGGLFSAHTKLINFHRDIISLARVFFYFCLGWLLGCRKDAWGIIHSGVQRWCFFKNERGTND